MVPLAFGIATHWLFEVTQCECFFFIKGRGSIFFFPLHLFPLLFSKPPSMSFRKRNADQQPKLPPGSRLSAYNGQLLISTGVPSLDDILGGGLPVGTVLLVKEDRATTYAQLLLKYFLAQGLASHHHCALVSKDEDPTEMTRNLMWLASSDADLDDDDTNTTGKATSGESDRMKIAWRYSHLKKFETSVSAKPGKQIHLMVFT
jgi:elongator complex protein 4